MVEFACNLTENQTYWKNGQTGRYQRPDPASTEVDSVSTLPVPAKSTSVYKYYDKSNVLIYVGITHQGIGRNRQHNADKEWWRFVHKQEVEHFESREEAHRREVELIERHLPPFNKQHNVVHDVVRPAYLAIAANPKARHDDLNKTVKEHRVIQLSIREMTNTTLTLITDVADMAIVANLHYIKTERPAVYDQSNALLGHVCGIENRTAFCVVEVRLRKPIVGSVLKIEGHIKVPGRALFKCMCFRKIVVELLVLQ